MYVHCWCDGCDASSFTHSKICANSSPASFNLPIVKEQALPFKAQKCTNSPISSPICVDDLPEILLPTPLAPTLVPLTIDTLIHAFKTRLWIAMLKVLLVQNLEQRHHTHRSQRHHQGPSNSRPDFEWQCCRYYWFPILSRDIIKGPVGSIDH